MIRWSINTKYYTADVAVWMAHLDEQFSIEKLPMYDQLAALIMVFDTTEVGVNVIHHFEKFVELLIVLFFLV